MGLRFSGSAVRLASIVTVILLWQLSTAFWEPQLLPSPLLVAQTLWSHAVTGELANHLGITLIRVGLSFSVALIIGTSLGLLMGQFRQLDSVLDGLVTLGLNIPALVVIILCFIWFGLNEFAAVLAVVLNKVPTIAVTMREGAKAVDRSLLQVGEVHGLSGRRVFTGIYLPQIYPYLLAAARSGLALVWKIVLVVELLGCSEGVGFQLGLFFQYFDIAGIFAYTLAFAAIILCIEWVVIRPWEQSIMRWRG